MLDYDNSAFYYFMISMLALYMVPGWILTFRAVIKAFMGVEDPSNVVRSKLEKQKLEKMKKNEKGLATLKNTCFLVNLVVLSIASLLFTYLVVMAMSDSELARFDPYKILDIDRGATDKQIKRAYKIKALEFHPDKNIGNKKAEQMFMMVAKAYEALTDEAAKENWELYGNPDGKQSLEVSIGLPTFLLDKDNHNVILIVYLICLVVIIPVIVFVYYNHAKQYGENNVMYSTYAFFARAGLVEHSTVKSLPEVLACATEFSKLNRVADQETYETFDKLNKLMRGKNLEGFMAKPRFDRAAGGMGATFMKGTVLLHSHLGRKTLEPHGITIPEKAQKDVEVMLSQSVQLITAMLDICIGNHWLQTALKVMEFSQYLTQGLWIKDPKHLQLPHISAKEVAKHLSKGKDTKEFKDYVQYLLKGDDAKPKGLAGLGDDEVSDIMDVCKVIPNLKVSLKWFVEDEEEIAEKDTVTLEITLDRQNLEEGTKAGPVHAPFFPVKKEEGWWVVLVERSTNHLVTIEKITDPSKKVVKEIKFGAPPRAGTYKFKVHVVSDSYLGLDQEIPFDMKVIQAAELPEYEAHQEDLELDNEASLFEQLATANQDLDESSDEEDEAPEQGPEAPGGAASADKDAEGLNLDDAAKRKRAKRLALKAKKNANNDEDETSDEEDDDEDAPTVPQNPNAVIEPVEVD